MARKNPMSIPGIEIYSVCFTHFSDDGSNTLPINSQDVIFKWYLDYLNKSTL